VSARSSRRRIAAARVPCSRHVRFCRFRFKFQSNLVWDSIKPISNFAFNLWQKNLTIKCLELTKRHAYSVDLYLLTLCAPDPAVS
jgi:hypothetical protein